MRLLRMAAKNEAILYESVKPENIVICLGNKGNQIKWRKYDYSAYTLDSKGVLPSEALEAIKEDKPYEPVILSENISSNEVSSLTRALKQADSKINPKPMTYKDFEKNLESLSKGPVIHNARNPLNAVICFGDRKYDSIFETLPYSSFYGYASEAEKCIEEYDFKKPYVVASKTDDQNAKSVADSKGVKLLTYEQFFQLEKVLPRVIKGYGEAVEDGCRSYGLSSKSVDDNEKSKKKIILKFEDEDNNKTYKFELPLKGDGVGKVKVYKETKSLGIFITTYKIGEIQFMDNGKVLITPDKIGSHVARLLEAK